MQLLKPKARARGKILLSTDFVDFYVEAITVCFSWRSPTSLSSCIFGYVFFWSVLTFTIFYLTATYCYLFCFVTSGTFFSSHIQQRMEITNIKQLME